MSGEILLPAVGYHHPALLQPRYWPRWERLLAALAAAGIDPADWPYRAEGKLGLVSRTWWLLKWEMEGEGAVLEALEQRWAEQQPRVRRGKRGPQPMTTGSAVEAKRAQLEAADEPAGERSIARALGVSRDAVRYAQGKDRRNNRKLPATRHPD